MKKYLNGIVDTAKRGKIFLFVFAATYLIGILVGALFTTDLAAAVLSKSAVDFYIKALGNGGNVFSLAASALFADAVLLIVFYLCSFSVFLIVIDLLFVFYRAYIVASVFSAFFTLFGVGGVFLYVFCVFLRNFLSFAALAYFASSVYVDLKGKCKCVAAVRKTSLIVCGAVMLAATLIEIVILCLILRPINLSF